MNFWDNLPKPFFALAPMEDVTDIVFRHVIARAAPPDVFFTEFTNAASFCSEKGEPSTRGRLTFEPDEQPIVAQIWGSKPENFATMAKALSDKGFAGIDINMGCPDKKVVKSGGGSALIENPELASGLIQAAKTSGLPISVKTRLGARSLDEWQPWLTHILNHDLAAVTVHLRTRKEMSKVPAHYELIPDIIELRDQIAPQTKLIINGDIMDRQHGMELWRQHPGLDGIMIGRGVFANPFAFENDAKAHNEKELLNLLEFHLDLYDKYQVITNRKFDPLKRFFKVYIKDFPGARELRDQLMHCRNTDEVRDILARLTER